LGPTAGEQKIAGLLLRHPNVVVDGLSGLLRQLKPDGPSCFPLAHGGSINGISVGCDIIDFDGDNVAAPELAVDRKIEQRQVTDLLLQLKFGPDGPDVFGPKGRFCAGQLTLIPWDPFCGGRHQILIVVHGLAPLLPRTRRCTARFDVGFCGRDQGFCRLTAMANKPALLTRS
jgi:hypothetical protein